MRIWLCWLAACAPAQRSAAPAVVADPPSPVAPSLSVETVPGSTGPLPVIGPCAVVLQCSAEIVDEPKVSCALQIVDERGLSVYDGAAGVERRGRSSMGFPKPQYGVELWDEKGLAIAADLLHMGSDPDWVLNGAYIDRAMLRNKLAYDLFQGWGGEERYAPQSASCVLTLNGLPQGVYFLGESIKADDDRIVLSDDTSGAAFVVKLEDTGGIVDNTPVGFGTWEVLDPGAASPEALVVVSDWLLGWQDAILGDDPAAIFAWVDLDSAVDFVLLQELLKNNDAYFLSVHLWKDVGDTLHFTPWDLDLTLGQPTYNNNVVPEEWVLYRPLMVARMGDDPVFHARLGERWRELRATTLTDAALTGQVEAHRAILGESLYENYQIWAWDDIYLTWDTLPLVADVDAEYANIAAWLPARTAWIDANIDSW